MNFISALTDSLWTYKKNQLIKDTDPQFERKLSSISSELLKSAPKLQFEAWNYLHSKQFDLQAKLASTYNNETVNFESVVAILKFYTILLTNCTHELIVYKILSDLFVIKLCQGRNSEKLLQETDREEMQTYRIALLKAYISRIDRQSLKYMINQEGMPIFKACVQAYYSSLDDPIGLEHTCVTNCILSLVSKSDECEETSAIIFEEGSLFYAMLESLLKEISQAMLNLGKAVEESMNFLEVADILQARCLLVADLIGSVKGQNYKEKCLEFIYKSTEDLLLEAKTLPRMSFLQTDLIRPLTQLFTGLNFEQRWVKQLQNLCQPISAKALVLLQANQPYVTNFMCNSMHLISIAVTSKYSFYADRNVHTKQDSLLEMQLLKMISSKKCCFCCLKNLLLCIFTLTMKNNKIQGEQQISLQKTILNLFLFYSDVLKTRLKDSQHWDAIACSYEQVMQQSNMELLTPSISGVFCKRHKPIFRTEEQEEQMSIEQLLQIYQCFRNFRFMLVSSTSIPKNNLKLEKTYFNEFSSTGLNYQPGKIRSMELKKLSSASMQVKNSSTLDVQILQDTECFILVKELSQQHMCKVILNIRFKSIEGFEHNENSIDIKLLKGFQDLKLKMANKQALKKVKQYLRQRKESSRQRQLTFLSTNLAMFYKDAQEIYKESFGQRTQTKQNQKPCQE